MKIIIVDSIPIHWLLWLLPTFIMPNSLNKPMSILFFTKYSNFTDGSLMKKRRGSTSGTKKISTKRKRSRPNVHSYRSVIPSTKATSWLKIVTGSQRSRSCSEIFIISAFQQLRMKYNKYTKRIASFQRKNSKPWLRRNFQRTIL